MQDRGYEKQNKHTGMEVGLRERGPGSWSRPWVKPWVEPVLRVYISKKTGSTSF